MSNPLYQTLGGNQSAGGMDEMLRAFEDFRRGFRGDPKQTVQNLLNSGQMTQAQFNQLAQQANQLVKYLGK